MADQQQPHPFLGVLEEIPQHAPPPPGPAGAGDIDVMANFLAGGTLVDEAFLNEVVEFKAPPPPPPRRRRDYADDGLERPVLRVQYRGNTVYVTVQRKTKPGQPGESRLEDKESGRVYMTGAINAEGQVAGGKLAQLGVDRESLLVRREHKEGRMTRIIFERTIKLQDGQWMWCVPGVHNLSEFVLTTVSKEEAGGRAGEGEEFGAGGGDGGAARGVAVDPKPKPAAKKRARSQPPAPQALAPPPPAPAGEGGAAGAPAGAAGGAIDPPLPQ